MNKSIAEQYAKLIIEARELEDRAKMLKHEASLIHDIVLQEMLDDLIKRVPTQYGTVWIDSPVWAQFRNNDGQRAIRIVHESIPDLQSVNHQKATSLMRQYLDERGSEFFEKPSDAFSEAFEPGWATKLMVRRNSRK